MNWHTRAVSSFCSRVRRDEVGGEVAWERGGTTEVPGGVLAANNTKPNLAWKNMRVIVYDLDSTSQQTESWELVL